MEIVDTVYLVAYFRPSDPLHGTAVEVVENLSLERRVSQIALVEFDLLMKSRRLSQSDRISAWVLLQGLIGADAIELVTPLDMAAATFLSSRYGIDYFDSIIAGQCLLRKAKPLTTDEEIIRTVNMSKEIRKQMKELGIL